MPDNLTPKDRQKTMRAVKGKGTKLERQLSAMLSGMRMRGWKKNLAEVTGKPDVVFPSRRVAVFVDGCFWHGCPHCNRKLPATNRKYWKEKITRNILRDQCNNEELANDGWRVVRIWEHEMNDPATRQTVRLRLQKTFAKGVKGWKRK